MSWGNGLKFAFKLNEYFQLHLEWLQWRPGEWAWGQTFITLCWSCRYLTCMEGRIQCLLSPPPPWTAAHNPERPPWRGQTYCPRRTSGHLNSTEEVPEQTHKTERKGRSEWSLEGNLNNDESAGLENNARITFDLSVSDSKYEWFPYGTRRYLKREEKCCLSFISCWLI